MGAGRRSATGLAGVIAAAALALPGGVRAAVSPVAAENALPGDGGWRLARRAADGQLEGYAGATSVNHGEAIDLHVRADVAQRLSWALYRMGWYGGAEGRRVASGGPVDVGPRPTPAPTATGLVECAWPTTFTIQTDASWTSGVYLVVLTRADGPQSWVPFVVRADERKGAAVVQSSVTTWQAYNFWGGKSLYVGGPAVEVSFDRPYAEGNGSGQYFRYEHAFVTWAEARGLDLVYVTNVDVDRDPSLLAGQRLFLSIGHDEYWSRPARAAVEQAIASGVSAAFLSGNAVYWQIRLEPGRASGRPRRTQVCYKKRVADDPLGTTPLATVRWRDPPVSAPENALLGVEYTSWLLVDGAWVVADPASWLFEGTGLAAGDAIPGVVGYESDRTVGDVPAGTHVVARSPVIDVAGRPDVSEAVVRDTPAGGFVFAAGTIEWAWGLSHPRHADARARRITENLFRRAGLEPASGDPPLPSAPAEVWSDGVRSVLPFAGAPFDEGLRDGPARDARFRRPTAAAVDAGGNVFVADTGNHAVRMIRNDADHTVVTIAGDGTPGYALGDGASARLRAPAGIGVAPDGTVIVADTGNERLLRLRSKGSGWSVERLAGADAWTGFADGDGASARFSSPSGLVLAGGKLYVADRQNHAIRRVDPASGRTDTLAGGGGSGFADGTGRSARFTFPADLAVAGDTLYVVDAGNRALRRVSTSSGAASTVAGPRGGGYDACGFADGPAAGARFAAAGGVLADGGDLLVADAGNARLRRVRGDEVTTIAGSGIYGAADGAAQDARLAVPTGVVRVGDGEWLVVDNGSSTIRRLSATEPPPLVAADGGGVGAGGGHGCASGGAGSALALLAGAGIARALGRRRR